MAYEHQRALTQFYTAMTIFKKVADSGQGIASIPYDVYMGILSRRVFDKTAREIRRDPPTVEASYYPSNGFAGRREFASALNTISFALMKLIYRDLQDTSHSERYHGLTGRLVDAIAELELPVRYPADDRLLKAVGEDDPQKFARLMQPLALSYLQWEMAERLAAKGIREIPSTHDFSDDPDLGSLNYIFSRVAADPDDFVYLGVALDLTGCEYEDPKLLQPLMREKSVPSPV